MLGCGAVRRSAVLGTSRAQRRRVRRRDGRIVATATGDRFARLWDAARRLLRTIDQRGFVADVAFSPDGRLLATAGPTARPASGTSRTGRLRRELRVTTVGSWTSPFSRRGRALATGEHGRHGASLERAERAIVVPLIGHRNAVRRPSTPTATWIVTGARTAPRAPGRPRTATQRRSWPATRGSPQRVFTSRRTVADGRRRRHGPLWDAGTEPDSACRPRGEGRRRACARARDRRRRGDREGVGRRSWSTPRTGELVLKGHRDVVTRWRSAPTDACSRLEPRPRPAPVGLPSGRLRCRAEAPLRLRRGRALQPRRPLARQRGARYGRALVPSPAAGTSVCSAGPSRCSPRRRSARTAADVLTTEKAGTAAEVALRHLWDSRRAAGARREPAGRARPFVHGRRARALLRLRLRQLVRLRRQRGEAGLQDVVCRRGRERPHE